MYTYIKLKLAYLMLHRQQRIRCHAGTNELFEQQVKISLTENIMFLILQHFAVKLKLQIHSKCFVKN